MTFLPPLFLFILIDQRQDEPSLAVSKVQTAQQRAQYTTLWDPLHLLIQLTSEPHYVIADVQLELLLDLLRSGLLDIRAIRPRAFPLARLPEAMEAAAHANNLECVVVKP